MAAPRLFTRFLTLNKLSPTSLTRAFSSTATATATATASSLPRFSLLRPLSSAIRPSSDPISFPFFSRTFSTRRSQNYGDDGHNSSRPPKETILLDGCDFEHWLVVVEPPPQDWTRDQIIQHYVQTLAKIVGSEEEARMKIYSVSTKHYFAFGALISEELSNKLKDMEGIRWVLPDSYLDVKNKDYGGEPFINGQAVPYDSKYHEEWVRNNQKANERNRRNDRPRNNDRSRNFDRRPRPQGYQNNASPGGNMGGMPLQGGAPDNAGPGQQMFPNNAVHSQNMAPNNAGYQQNMAPPNAGYRQNTTPPNAGYQQNMAPPNTGYQQNVAPPNADYQQNVAQNNQGFASNMSGPPLNYGAQGNPGYANTMPNHQGGGGAPYQSTQMGGQSNMVGGGYQTQNVPGRD